MRIRRKPGTREKLVVHPLVQSEPQMWQGKWRQFFGNKNPLYVELGTGKGKFITTLAKLFPAINYLGVEKVEEVLLKAVLQAESLEIRNIAFIWTDIVELSKAFGYGEVDRFYLNFSDPWPKNRHAKNRLTHPDFLGVYQQLLKPGGEIHLKTDNEQLFEFSLNQFAASGWHLQNICLDLASRGPDFNVTTEYEEKFQEQGCKIFRLEAVRP